MADEPWKAYQTATKPPATEDGPWANYQPATPTQAAPAAPKLQRPESSLLRRVVGDTGVDLAKGVLGVGEAAVGLLDIPTAGAVGNALSQVGYDPQGAKQFLGDELYSPERQAANAEVQNAEGFLGTAGAMLRNPSTIAGAVVESAPSVLAGGAIGKGVQLATGLARPALLAGIGEGAVGAGSAAEQLRQTNDTGTLNAREIAASVGSGIGTGLLGAAGGALARKLGIVDPDTAFVGGTVVPAASGNVLTRAARGAVAEGLLEEAPQSAQEQAFQNFATDRPLTEGVAEATAQGALTGAAMGGPISGLVRPTVNPNAGPISRAASAGPAIPHPNAAPNSLAAAANDLTVKGVPATEATLTDAIQREKQRKKEGKKQETQPASVSEPVQAPLGMDPATGEVPAPVRAEPVQPVEVTQSGQPDTQIGQPETAGRAAYLADQGRQNGRVPGVTDIVRAFNVHPDQARALRKEALELLKVQSTPPTNSQPPENGDGQADVADASPSPVASVGSLGDGVDAQGQPDAARATAEDSAPVAEGDPRNRDSAGGPAREPALADDAAGAQAEGLTFDESDELQDDDVGPASGGAFSIRGAAEQEASRRPGSRVVELADGGFVVREPRQAPASGEVQPQASEPSSLDRTESADRTTAPTQAAPQAAPAQAQEPEQAPLAAAKTSSPSQAQAPTTPDSPESRGTASSPEIESVASSVTPEGAQPEGADLSAENQVPPVGNAARPQATAQPQPVPAAPVPAQGEAQTAPVSESGPASAAEGAHFTGQRNVTTADHAAALSQAKAAVERQLGRLKGDELQKKVKGILSVFGQKPARSRAKDLAAVLATMDQNPHTALYDLDLLHSLPASVRDPLTAKMEGRVSEAPAKAANASTKRRAPTEAQKAEGIVATQGPEDAKGERKFYVTMMRDSRVARLAGPFDTKEEAESHVKAATEKAQEMDPRASFDSFGVSAVTSEDHKPGKLNERLGIAQPAAPTQAEPAKAETSSGRVTLGRMERTAQAVRGKRVRDGEGEGVVINHNSVDDSFNVRWTSGPNAGETLRVPLRDAADVEVLDPKAPYDHAAFVKLRRQFDKEDAAKAATAKTQERERVATKVAGIEAEAREARPLIERAQKGTKAQQEAAHEYAEGNIDLDEFKAAMDSTPTAGDKADSQQGAGQPTKLRNFSWDAVKLADAYGYDELNTLRAEVEAQHANPKNARGAHVENGSETIYLYDREGRRKLDALAWAVTYKQQESRAEKERIAAEIAKANPPPVTPAYVAPSARPAPAPAPAPQPSKPAEPVKMTMAEWKSIGKDFKGIIDGQRTMMRDGRIVPVEIIKEEKTGQPTKEKGKAEVPNDARAIVKAQHELFTRLRKGEATLDDYKAGWEALRANREAVKAHLATLKKMDLLDLAGPRYRNDPKPRVVDAALDSLVSNYQIGRGISFSMGAGQYEKAVQAQIDGTTDADLAAYAERFAEARKEREKALAGMENPETLKDFIRLARSNEKGEEGLSPEHRARLDALRTEARREDREAQAKRNAEIRRVDTGATGMQLVETKHTQKGHDLFVVKTEERVDREVYNALNIAAKRLGGHYSSYRGNGAIPGFTFTTREAAEQFMAVREGNVDASAQQEARAEKKAEARAETLAEKAATLKERAQEKLNRDRNTNTARRAAHAASAEADARRDIAIADTMAKLGKAIEAGDAKLLQFVRHKTQIELFDSLLRRAHEDHMRALGVNWEKAKEQPITAESITNAKLPQFTISRGELAVVAKRLVEKRGGKSIGEALSKMVDYGDEYGKAVQQSPFKFVLGVQRSDGSDARSAVFATKREADAVLARSPERAKGVVVKLPDGFIGDRTKKWAVAMSPELAIERKLWAPDYDKKVTLNQQAAEKIVDLLGSGYGTAVPYWFESRLDQRKQFAKLGIETNYEFREALREYLALRQEPAEEDRIRKLERKLVGDKSVGVDFFPTPPAVIQRLLEQADVGPDMRVLEPSAGKGDIAEALRDAAEGVQVDTVEMSHTLRELLEAKGFAPASGDFLQHESGAVYDRIVMNPPFGNDNGASHVQHAFTMLKPGGRLVAVMGAGTRGKAAFEAWLESVGGLSEPLPEGSFKSSFRPTGVATQVVVIDKDTNAPDERTRKGDEVAAAPTFSRTARATIPPSGIPQGLPLHASASVLKLERSLRAFARSDGEAPRIRAVQPDSLPDALRGALAALERFSGTRVEIIRNLNADRSGLTFDGVTLRDGVLFVDETATHPATTVASHEFTHQLMADRPDLYAFLEAEVRRQGRLPEWMAELESRGETRAQQVGVHELVADAVGDALSDHAFLEGMAKRNPSKFRQLADAFLRFLDGLIGSFANNLGSNQYLTDVSAFRDLLADVLDQYANEGPAPSSDADNAPQFSRAALADDFDLIENNGSGDSSASIEAINRRLENKALGQVRVLIERDGSVRALLGVDAVDTHARSGQIIVQRGVGKEEWTVLSQGNDVSRDLAQGRLNAARPKIADLLADDEPLFSRPKVSDRVPADAVDDIEAVMSAGDDRKLLQQAKDKLADLTPAKVKDALRGTWLGALTTNHLTELGSDYFTNIKHYSDFLGEMNADRNQLQQEGEEMAEPWRQWASKHPAEQKELAGVMHDATIDGVDPSKAYQPLQFRYASKLWDATPKNVKEAIKAITQQMRERSGDSKANMLDEIKALRAMRNAETRRKAQYPELVKRYAALSDEAKGFFAQVRDAYLARSKMVEDGLVQRIEDTEAPDHQKRRLITTIRQQFETHRLQGVYFPLQRHGQYFVAAEKGDTHSFLMTDSLSDLERKVKSLRERGWTIKAQGLKAQGKAAEAPSGTFVADVITQLQKAGVSDATQDSIYQMYLEALPELSMRKHAIHRKNVPGFDPDAIRAFAFNMHHGAHQIARLRYAHKLSDTIALLKEQQNKARTEEGADTRKIAAGDAILGELDKRHAWINNPTDSNVTGVVSSFGFAYYLGLTPAASLVNLSQTALVTFPHLAARYGPIKAFNALLSGMADSVATLGHAQKKLTDPEELAAHAELQRMGALDKTQAHNLAGIAEGGMAGYNPGWAKAMKIIGWGFHKTEVVNREATGMATYRLARKAGETHEQAIKSAARAIQDTHFDYTNQNRARFMQSGTAKVLLMFRQYSLNMTWHLGRMLWQATKGQDAETRKIARRNLAGVLGMSALFSGTLGLPLMSVTFGVLNAIAASFGDDDEPWDAETEFRAFLNEMFGEGAGDVLANGAVNKLTGADIASRVSLSQLWFRDADRELDGRGAYFNLLEQAAGPMGGVLKNALVGKQMIDDGHVMRGIETMLPKALKDTVKAQRYATEGVNNLRGDPLVADVSLRQMLLQLAGFTPDQVTKQYDTNRSLKNYEQAILDRRETLTNAFAMAVRTDDEEARVATFEKIKAFNAKYPEIPITMKGLRQSIARRARYSQDAENGIVLNRRLARRVHEEVEG